MPGKVNPTQSEAVTMVCVKKLVIIMELQWQDLMGILNQKVFKPLIIHNIFNLLRIMSDSAQTFSIYCVKGIKADKKGLNIF